jgi:hypothetical protein
MIGSRSIRSRSFSRTGACVIEAHLFEPFDGNDKGNDCVPRCARACQDRTYGMGSHHKGPAAIQLHRN